MSNLHIKTEDLGRNISDFLKYEATPLTRVSVAAEEGTKIGTFVDYPARSGKKLIALSDESGGTVIVQPHNCVVDLTFATGVPDTVVADGDAFGIVYQNVPAAGLVGV